MQAATPIRCQKEEKINITSQTLVSEMGIIPAFW